MKKLIYNNRNERKVNPIIYLNAFKLFFNPKNTNVFACDNIGDAGKDIYSNYQYCLELEHKLFEEYFYEPSIVWRANDLDPGYGCGWWHEKDQESRYIALLLMYWIAKDLE